MTAIISVIGLVVLKSCDLHGIGAYYWRYWRTCAGEHTVPTAVYPLIAIRIASEEYLEWIIR